MRFLELTLEAPLMSFGAVAVDANRGAGDHPTRSMLTGLLGNALGWTHGETERLARLQERLVLGSRCDVPGTVLEDFHTVGLDQDFLQAGWTTWGAAEGREGGSASTGTHIRHREYLVGARWTVLVGLDPADESPTLDDLVQALLEPARPLFLGRKTCLPSRPLLGAAPTFVEGALPDLLRVGQGVVWYPAADVDDALPRGGQYVPVRDTRDWANQRMEGLRWEIREARDGG